MVLVGFGAGVDWNFGMSRKEKSEMKIAPLAKFIDWYSLQVAALLPSIRKCARGDSKLTEAVAFLNGPDFIPAESEPAELEFKSKIGS